MSLPSLLGTAAIVEASLAEGAGVLAARLAAAGQRGALSPGEKSWLAAASAFGDVGSMMGHPPEATFACLENTLRNRRGPHPILRPILLRWFGHELSGTELLRAACSGPTGRPPPSDHGAGVPTALVQAVRSLDDRLQTHFPDACRPEGMTYVMKRLFAGIVALGMHACEGVLRGSLDWPEIQVAAFERLLNLHLDARATSWPESILPGPPRGVQGCPVPCEPGVTLLEDIVRGGKLVGALSLAIARIRTGLADNLIIVCRTRAGVLHIYDEIRALLPRVLIVRGLPWDFLPDPSWHTKLTARYLLAPICVTTLEQIANGMRLEKHAYLRSLAIARAVVILDDLYASDNRDRALARALIHGAQLLIGGHTILTSATLDAAARRQLLFDLDSKVEDAPRSAEQPYSCIWHRGLDADPDRTRARATEERPHDIVETTLIRTSVEAPDGKLLLMSPAEVNEAIAHMTIGSYRHGAKVLVVRNTNSDALRTAMRIEELSPGAQIRVNDQVVAYLKWYTPEDRHQIDLATRAAMGYGAPREACIVVATPQIENGLYLNADIIYTDFAPFDALLRRSGRMHARPGRRPPGFGTPRMIIMAPPIAATFLETVEEGTGRPRRLPRGIGTVHEDMFDLERTLDWLETHGRIDRGQPREAIEAIYHPHNQAAMRRAPGWAQHHAWLMGQLGLVDAAVGTLRWDADPRMPFGAKSCDPRLLASGRHPEEAYLPDWPRRVYFGDTLSPLGTTMNACVVKAWPEIPRGSRVSATMGPNGSWLFGRDLTRTYDNWGFRTLDADERTEED